MENLPNITQPPVPPIQVQGPNQPIRGATLGAIPAGAAPAPRPAIQAPDLLISPHAGKLREIERKLGAGLEKVSRPSIVASRINKLLEERRNRRMDIEEEWLDSYRRYNAEYSGAVRARLLAQPNRSKLFVDLTRMKTDAAHADIMSVLRPPGGEAPWLLKPDEIPETDPMPDGVSAGEVKEDRKKRVRGMATEIKNQLSDSDFDEGLDMAVLEQCILGTGAMKGPFTMPDTKPRWDMFMDANQKAVVSYNRPTGYRPAVKYVSIVNCYPDMELMNVQDGDMIEVMPMSRRQFMRLVDAPRINAGAVLRCLREFPEGNYTPLPHIQELRRISRDAWPSVSKMYEVICYYGEITGNELREAGVDVDDAHLHLSVTAEILISDPYILRIRKHDGPIPYYLFNYRRRATVSPYGKGVPQLVKNSQDAINGAARFIMDNAAIASGPMVELNMMLMRMQPGQDPTDIHGWKVYTSSHDGHSGKRAVHITDLPAYTEQFIRIIDLFRRFMDEESGQPSLSTGMTSQGTTKTATGMSILNTNSSKIRNHTVRYVDDQLIEPLIEGMYDWNMRYSVKEWLLVPARVQAIGAQSLMAREIESQRILSAFQMFMGHPAFKENQAMRSFFRAVGLPADEYALSDEEMMEQQAAQQQGAPGQHPNAGAPPMRQNPGPAPGAPPVGQGSGMI